MSKIKKFFTIIVSAITVPFLQMGIVFAEQPMPSATVSLPEYYATVIPITHYIAIYSIIIAIALLIFVLPLLTILIMNISKRIKQQGEDQNVENQQQDVEELKRIKKWMKIAVIFILCSVVFSLICFLPEPFKAHIVIVNTFRNDYFSFFAYSVIVGIVIDIFILAIRSNRKK